MKKTTILAGLMVSISIISCQKAQLSDYTTEPAISSFRGELGSAGDDASGTSKGNSSNFNGTAIPDGRYIWFNTHVDVGNYDINTKIKFKNSVISFVSDGQTYNLNVPKSELSFLPAGQPASYSYNENSNTNIIKVPVNNNDDILIGGLAYKVPTGGLPGGIKPVNWQATFSSNKAGVNIAWQWSAAVYTDFSTNYNLLGLNITGTHPGTPSNYKQYVKGGARGGGGSNWTGSWSGTVNFDLLGD